MTAKHSDPNLEKHCQSCAMPLKPDKLGTEANQQPANHYCHYCYQNGNYTEPDITYEQMKQRGLHLIANMQANRFLIAAMQFFYPKLLKRMRRWDSA